MLSRCNHPSRVRPRSHPHERRRARGGRQPGLTSRTSPASASAPRLRLPLGEVATLGAITSVLFLTAREGPRRTFPAAGAFVCLLVRGQAGGATVDTAGGATVDAAGGATVDVRTAAAGGAAAARTPAVAVAAPARLSPAIARAAKLVRTDISVSLDDRKSRGIRSTYLIFQLITRTPRSGCSKAVRRLSVNIGLRTRASCHISQAQPQPQPQPQRQARTAPERGPLRGEFKGRLGPGFAHRWLVDGRVDDLCAFGRLPGILTALAPGRKRRCCADRLAAISPAEATGSDPAPGQRPTFRVVRGPCPCRPRCYDYGHGQIFEQSTTCLSCSPASARTHTARRPQAKENP